MYVKKVDLINIRSYENANLELSKGINLITGANNSGKSTLLKSIQKLQSVNSELAREDIRKTCGTARIHLQLDDITRSDLTLFGTNDKNRGIPFNKTISLLFGMYASETSQDHLLVNPFISQVLVGEDIIAVPLKENGINDFINFSGFPNSEDKQNFIYPFFSKRKTHNYSASGGRQAAYSIDEDFRNLPNKIQSLTNPSHSFHKDYVKHCKEILGFDIGKVPANENNTQDKIGIFATNSDLIYLESMGEGVVNILGLLAILLTEDNKLFLIEELENDIHPQALKKLLNLIIEKSANNQFVISTHSNIVLKYLASTPNSKIFYTDWKITSKNTGRIKLPTSSIKEVENTPEKRLHILEKLGYDLMDFDFFKSYILFEESSAEQIVRDFLIPEFVPNLKNTVKTIAANGASDLTARFTDFLRLFVYIHTNSIYRNRAWVIADGDAEGKQSITKLKQKFKNWPAEHFIDLEKNNFEEYYPEPFKSTFDKIQQNPNKDERRLNKIKLTQEIVNWINGDRPKAKRAFEKSAKEIITILKTINTKLSGN